MKETSNTNQQHTITPTKKNRQFTIANNTLIKKKVFFDQDSPPSSPRNFPVSQQIESDLKEENSENNRKINFLKFMNIFKTLNLLTSLQKVFILYFYFIFNYFYFYFYFLFYLFLIIFYFYSYFLFYLFFFLFLFLFLLFFIFYLYF